MITDERIVELKIPFGELPICGEIIDFARALLGEVSLQDMLRKEEEFVRDNRDSFINEFISNCNRHFTVGFNSSSVRVVYVLGGHKGVDERNISLTSYYQWKKTILDSEK